MENNIEMIENMLNTERRNRRGNREIRFEVNSNYYEAVSKLLSDYKRVLKENEELRIKNNAIKRESEVYAEHMIRLDNELNLEKEKSKYEWIRQNCLPQELVNKLYIPIQKVKDKIEEILNNGEYRIIFEGDAEFPDEATCIDAQKYIKLEKLQELLEGRK